MIASVAAMAPCSPPETGASSMSTPCSDKRCASERAISGAMVLMSTRIEPAANPSDQAVRAEGHLLDVGSGGNDREHHL
jgi:hypothetical protein